MSRLGKKSVELQEIVKSISNKVDVDVVEGGLLTDALIRDIFTKSKPIPTTDELFGKAQMRMALGNPPGKNGSLGDAINWIAVLESVPDGENLHVISEDGDFYSTLDESRPHPFLKAEWAKKKGAELFVYRTLSSFLKQHFDGVAFSYDKDKEALIEGLADAGSFAVTHNLVAKLEKFNYFSLKEVERILAAAIGNNQFGWIVGDDDIYNFLNRVAVPRLGVLAEPDQIQLLLDMLDHKAKSG